MTNPKNWQQIRAELMQLKNKLGIVDEDFRPLSPYENHQKIEEKIYQTFCQITDGKKRPKWLWQVFKHDCYVLNNTLIADPFEHLDKIIPNDDDIWVAVQENLYNAKLWFYEGKIISIQKILEETNNYAEIYFVSKKFEWLICINHADTMIATGSDMPKKLQALEKTLNGETP